MTLTKRLILIGMSVLTFFIGSLAVMQMRKQSDASVITIGTLDNSEVLEYPIIQQAEERLGIKFKIVTIPQENWATKIRLMVAGDTLPDVVTWYDVNFGEYYQFASAGIMKEFPDFSEYPNVKPIWDEKADYIDNFKVNGKYYLWPKNYMSNPFNDYSERIFAYRLDWVQEMGKLFGDATKSYYDAEKAEKYSSFTRVQHIGFDEFRDILRDFKALSGEIASDKVIPYLPDSHDDFLQLVVAFEKDFDNYIHTDSGYVWGPQTDGTREAVEFLNARYKEGLIYSDLATMTAWSGNNQFVGGNAFVLGSNGTLGYLNDLQARLEQNTGVNADEAFGVLVIADREGRLFDYNQADYWSGMFINAKISDEKLDKWMEFMNFIYDPEILRQFAYGMEGVDFEMKGNSVVLKWAQRPNGDYYLTNDKMYISQQGNILRWFELEGRVFWMSNCPLYKAEDKRLYTEIMEAKSSLAERGGENLHDINPEVAYFTGETYMKYGAYTKEISDAIILATVSESASGELNGFLESMSPRINPIIKELNEELG